MNLDECSAREQPLSGVRVLLVDDDVGGRDALYVALESRGADVVAVGTAGEALAAFEAAQPDILLSDLAISGEDGCELLKRVRRRDLARGGGVSAAAVTALDTPEDHMRASEAGFQLHVAKPVEPDYIVALVALLAGRFAELDDLLEELQTRSARHAVLSRRFHALQAERERLVRESHALRAAARSLRNDRM